MKEGGLKKESNGNSRRTTRTARIKWDDKELGSDGFISSRKNRPEAATSNVLDLNSQHAQKRGGEQIETVRGHD